MLHRIQLSIETDRRLNIHAAMVAGRDLSHIITRAVDEYLEKYATDTERTAWGSNDDAVFARQVVAEAKKFPRPFRLKEVLAQLGINVPYGQGLAREAGVALREAGFHDRRLRPPGCAPTQMWVSPKVLENERTLTDIVKKNRRYKPAVAVK